ncbi:FHA domain-containing protein [Vannielia litorea]|uniref:FHA domain-containing protein n=1 Tax=Vannielia litorea TaxID=1217970 RepID=UPI001C9450DD|nr:FHA domain-containing protein [Vannielia litorea]MBY6047854.1 FHA domain-containing protein [Vannielia litorea]MBY6075268.1 FHA domain-containing protein [Vannielia litorea]
MKFIGDLIPKRRPVHVDAPISAIAPTAGPDALDEAVEALAGDPDGQGARGPVRVVEGGQRPERQPGEARRKAVAAAARIEGIPREAPPEPAAPAIWDIEAPEADLPPPPTPDRAAPADPAVAPEPLHQAPAPVTPPIDPPLNPPRDAASDRVRTRLIGFGTEPQSDAFSATAARAEDTRFPIGWLVVVEGAGRGASFTLTSGLSTIGRGADQAICLDFGDTAISRECHAAVAYDEEERRVLVGHGGRSNIVRLNGEPLVSREEMQNGDLIRLGKTTLRFVAFCGPDFDWEQGAEGAADE